MAISDTADPQRWRFLEIDWITYAHTAIYRPVMVRAVGERIVPDTVSFCRFPRPSLILNYFNDPEKDIYLDFCRSRNIPVFRVISSGGPIWGDTGYIFTFLHIKRDNPLLPPDAPGMFEKTLTGVAQGISECFGVECRFRPLNDLEIKCEDGVWRKIGPSSCFYDEKAIQMGSGIQVKKPDDDLIAGAICAPPEKFADKETKTLRDRITYLERLVGRDIDLAEIRDIYWNQVQKTFGVELFEGELTQREKDYYREMESQYTAEEFFLERSEKRLGEIPQGVTRNLLLHKVAKGPLLRVITFTKDNRLWNLIISGSLHASPLRPTSPVHEIEKALIGQEVNQAVFREKIAEVLRRPRYDLPGLSPELLAEKIFTCATKAAD